MANSKSSKRKVARISSSDTDSECGERSKPFSTSVLRRNARERNRVKMVNDGFTLLRKHIPHIANKKKLSKVDTLRNAVDYIQGLQRLLNTGDAWRSALDPTDVSPPSSPYRTVVNFSTVPQGGIIIHPSHQQAAVSRDEKPCSDSEPMEADSTTSSEESSQYEILVRDEENDGFYEELSTLQEVPASLDLLSPPISDQSCPSPHTSSISTMSASPSAGISFAQSVVSSPRRERLIDVANIIQWERISE